MEGELLRLALVFDSGGSCMRYRVALLGFARSRGYHGEFVFSKVFVVIVIVVILVFSRGQIRGAVVGEDASALNARASTRPLVRGSGGARMGRWAHIKLDFGKRGGCCGWGVVGMGWGGGDCLWSCELVGTAQANDEA
jgi:hypothetical protein